MDNQMQGSKRKKLSVSLSVSKKRPLPGFEPGLGRARLREPVASHTRPHSRLKTNLGRRPTMVTTFAETPFKQKIPILNKNPILNKKRHFKNKNPAIRP